MIILKNKWHLNSTSSVHITVISTVMLEIKSLGLQCFHQNHLCHYRIINS